jgi:hypothetical protein
MIIWQKYSEDSFGANNPCLVQLVQLLHSRQGRNAMQKKHSLATESFIYPE